MKPITKTFFMEAVIARRCYERYLGFCEIGEMHLVVLSLLEFGLGLARVGAKFIETD
jgi:hypothetical protein